MSSQASQLLETASDDFYRELTRVTNMLKDVRVDQKLEESFRKFATIAPDLIRAAGKAIIRAKQAEQEMIHAKEPSKQAAISWSA